MVLVREDLMCTTHAKKDTSLETHKLQKSRAEYIEFKVGNLRNTNT